MYLTLFIYNVLQIKKMYKKMYLHYLSIKKCNTNKS